jgi:hypothetical protein
MWLFSVSTTRIRNGAPTVNRTAAHRHAHAADRISCSLEEKISLVFNEKSGIFCAFRGELRARFAVAF